MTQTVELQKARNLEVFFVLFFIIIIIFVKFFLTSLRSLEIDSISQSTSLRSLELDSISSQMQWSLSAQIEPGSKNNRVF